VIVVTLIGSDDSSVQHQMAAYPVSGAGAPVAATEARTSKRLRCALARNSIAEHSVRMRNSTADERARRCEV